MKLKFIFKLPPEVLPKKREWRQWLRELDRIFWDIIFVAMEDEKDTEGAALVADLFSLFFPFRVNTRAIQKLYPLRGWERYIPVPFPYLLAASCKHELKTPRDILMIAYLRLLSRCAQYSKSIPIRAKILLEMLKEG